MWFLLQTNVGNNNNKYYVIQVLKRTGDGSFHVWNRWGRVGYKGQNKLFPHGSDLAGAQAEFEKKYVGTVKLCILPVSFQALFISTEFVYFVILVTSCSRFFFAPTSMDFKMKTKIVKFLLILRAFWC